VGGERYNYKMEFFDALGAYTKELLEREERVVVLGDFNVALEDLDVYDPEVFEGAVGFLPWWDYRNAGIWRDEGMRIDYILANEKMCGECLNVEVDLWTRRRRSPTPSERRLRSPTPSDHAPLIAEFAELADSEEKE